MKSHGYDGAVTHDASRVFVDGIAVNGVRNDASHEEAAGMVVTRVNVAEVDVYVALEDVSRVYVALEDVSRIHGGGMDLNRVRMTADRLDALGNGFLTVAFLAVDAACARFGPVLKPSSGHCLDDCVLRWAHGPALRLRVTHSKPS